jgi:transposase
LASFGRCTRPGFTDRSLPPAQELLADRGNDSNRFRTGLLERDITPCIPSTRSRKVELPYDKTLYRQRHRIENTFGRLKDWRRVATRYDRCAHTLFKRRLVSVGRYALRGVSHPQELFTLDPDA